MIQWKTKGLPSLLTALAVAVALMAPEAALGRAPQSPQDGHGREAWRKSPAARILAHRDDLGLTGDQVKRLQAVENRSKESLEKRRTDLREGRRAFFEALDAGRIDRQEADRRIDALSRDLAALDRVRLQMIVEAREILTPEQRIKLRDMRRRRHEEPAGAAGHPPIAN